MLLNNKTVVITGCLHGIGRSALNVFASNGANIFACSYKQTDEFEDHCSELAKKCNVKIYPLYFDMTDINAIKLAVKFIQQTKVEINGLVNIAGIARDALFHMITTDQISQTFDINFDSQIIFSQYITKLMLRTGGGSVVFTSSITAMDGNKGQTIYGASKAALLSAVKTMSREFGPKGIRINAVAPGVIDTPMTAELGKDIIEGKLKKCSMARIGKPEEVANLMLFLISDLSSYITGQIIRIDGGIK